MMLQDSSNYWHRCLNGCLYEWVYIVCIVIVMGDWTAISVCLLTNIYCLHSYCTGWLKMSLFIWVLFWMSDYLLLLWLLPRMTTFHFCNGNSHDWQGIYPIHGYCHIWLIISVVLFLLRMTENPFFQWSLSRTSISNVCGYFPNERAPNHVLLLFLFCNSFQIS